MAGFRAFSVQHAGSTGSTKAGPIEFSHRAEVVKEKGEKGGNWYLNWDRRMFHPQLEEGDIIKSLEIEEGLRGDILDSNNEKLATYVDGIQVELNKKNFDKSNIEKVAKAISIEPETISGYLSEANKRTYINLVILS